MITRKSYYNNIDVRFELIHQQKDGRETFLLPFRYDINKKALISSQPIRWLMCNFLGKEHESGLIGKWKEYDFLDKDMNLYHSLANYELPRFSYNRRQKSEEQKLWMTHFKEYIKGYALLVETDSSDITESYKDSVTLKTFFDEYKQLYYISFSGKKGFHFLMPSSEFDFLDIDIYNEKFQRRSKEFNQLLKETPIDYKKAKKVIDRVLLFKILNIRLKTLLSCDTLDTSITDIKRVKKTAYSWDCKSGLIAYPLSDYQFDSFTKDMCKPENVLKQGIHKRRLLYRNIDIPKQERERLMFKMFKDVGILK